MDEQRQLLSDSVERLFRDAATDAAALSSTGFAAGLWAQLVELGLPSLLIAEDRGGYGGTWEDAYVVLHLAGRYNIPLPVGESMLASLLLASAGLDIPAGVISVAPELEGDLYQQQGQWFFSGTLRAVPWGREAGSVIAGVVHQHQVQVLILPAAAAQLNPAENLAGEPRDDLVFDEVAISATASNTLEARHLFDYCALLRTVQIAGALEAALQRSVDYARERRQFGKAIGQFQAVQQQLAVFGLEAAAAACAGRAACRAAVSGDASFEIAAAKLRANLAVGSGTAAAHQTHAAIGFTREYALRHSTQRLWSWRSEYGNDRYWSSRLGDTVAKRGAANFWADLTARDDAVGSQA